MLLKWLVSWEGHNVIPDTNTIWAHVAVENDNKIQTQVEMYNIMIRYMYVYVMCYITYIHT